MSGPGIWPSGPPHVYVAGPLSPDVLGGTRRALLAAREVRARGWIDYTPHTSILADLVTPEDYETWMLKCLAWVGRCDGLLRLPGRSPGSDREVVRALALGRPVACVDGDSDGGQFCGEAVDEAIEELAAEFFRRGLL